MGPCCCAFIVFSLVCCLAVVFGLSGIMITSLGKESFALLFIVYNMCAIHSILFIFFLLVSLVGYVLCLRLFLGIFFPILSKAYLISVYLCEYL